MKKRLILLALSLFLISPAYPQGVLPPKKSDTPATTPARTSLLIGETVPLSLTVMEGDGIVHPLLSYKASLNLLIVWFFSPNCAENQAQWGKFRRFAETYDGWRVDFVGVSVNSNETLEELQAAMKKARLKYKAVRDENQTLAKTFQVTSVPQVVILDEWGQFRYRGPIDQAGDVMEKIIDNAPFDPTPPPPQGCEIQ